MGSSVKRGGSEGGPVARGNFVGGGYVNLVVQAKRVLSQTLLSVVA
jgi:hypothetical protein